MTHEQILTKSIEKAFDKDPICFGIEFNLLSVYHDGCLLVVTLEVTQPDGSTEIKDIGYKSIIFNQEFAKAFWGEEDISYGEANYCIECGRPVRIKAWQYHLQQMVLEEEPLDYLEKFYK